MSTLLQRLQAPVRRRLKLALAGDDLDTLLRRRNRRRLRWLAEVAPDPLLAFRALRALAEIGGTDAIPLYRSLLANDAGESESASLRVAAEGLGRLRDADSAAALRRLLNPERPAQVQLAAARALATLGGEEDWIAIRGWATAASLWPDDRDIADGQAPDDLPAGTGVVVQVLQTLYAEKADLWWTAKARSWLESAEPKPRIPAMEGADKIVAQQLRLRLAAGSTDRREAMQLGSLARDRDQELLAERLASALEDRRTWLQALGLQGDPRSLEQLVAIAQAASEPEGARDALRALGRLGWRGSADVIGAVRDRFDDHGVRVEAACALGEIGGEDAVRILMDDLRKRADRRDPPEDESRWIALALRRCGLRGREAIRGARTIAISKGERRRVEHVAELAGIP